jgi:hypothetical protein
MVYGAHVRNRLLCSFLYTAERADTHVYKSVGFSIGRTGGRRCSTVGAWGEARLAGIPLRVPEADATSDGLRGIWIGRRPLRR